MRPTIATVGVLARSALEARRAGLDLRIGGGSRDLRLLIAFVGLEDVLCVELEREPEQGEESFRVEEERDLRNLAAGELDHL